MVSTDIGNRDFLDSVFVGLHEDEYLWTAQFKTSPVEAKSEQWAGLPVTSTYENFNKHHASWNHYFCVSSLKSATTKKRRKENFSRLFVLVLDDAKPIPDIEPTWVLCTSHPNNAEQLQVGYRLTEPVGDLDMAVAIHKALADAGHLGADKNGNNPVRYVRLPWGANTKYSPPHQHSLKYWNPDATVSIETLIECLGLNVDTTQSYNVAPVTITEPLVSQDYLPIARKIAWDAARRTHDNPHIGRHSEIFKMGAFAYRDGVPTEHLSFMLREFSQQMRPTNTKGELVGINWDGELKSIHDGYEQSVRDGKPALVNISGLIPSPIYTESNNDLPPFPDELVTSAPGVLGEIVSWGLRTAFKPQPHLALQAAIATACTVMSRRYRTNRNNWPMLWFLGIAVSASGKEHGKTIVEEVLASAEMEHLIGGAGYTSPGAVFSTLLDKPSHISLIDEFGKLIDSSQQKGNQIKADAMTTLIEIFGRAHGVLRPAAYSMMTLSKEQREAWQKRKVYRPAVNLLAMTTPQTFYDSINRQWVDDGFLGRFLVTESPIGRQGSVYPDPEDVPHVIAEWVREVVAANQGSGNIAFATQDQADMEPNPTTLRFTRQSTALLRAFESDILNRMDRAEHDGLVSLYGRTVEKAMRLGMVVCLADNPSYREITDAHMQYAIDYALACDDRLVEIAKKNISDSPFAKTKAKALEAIRRSGSKGMTTRDLSRKVSAYNALRPREQQEIFESLQKDGWVELREIKNNAGRGRKRMAYIAISPDDDEVHA